MRCVVNLRVSLRYVRNRNEGGCGLHGLQGFLEALQARYAAEGNAKRLSEAVVVARVGEQEDVPFSTPMGACTWMSEVKRLCFILNYLCANLRGESGHTFTFHRKRMRKSIKSCTFTKNFQRMLKEGYILVMIYNLAQE